MATPKLLAYGVLDTADPKVIYEVGSAVAAVLHQFIIFSQYGSDFTFQINLQAYLSGVWQTYCSWVEQTISPGDTRYIFSGNLEMSPSTRIVIDAEFASALSYTVTGTEQPV